jgi:hypothetical protein
MIGEENPYEEHSDEIEEYCEKCCKDCPPSEMCPGCDCSDYCGDEGDLYDDEEDYELDAICGEDSELDPLCHVEDEDEWW